MAIEVRPITATLGAEISGVDMADVSGETLEHLRKAWLAQPIDQPFEHFAAASHLSLGNCLHYAQTKLAVMVAVLLEQVHLDEPLVEWHVVPGVVDALFVPASL